MKKELEPICNFYIHSTAKVHPSVILGYGVFIGPNVTIKKNVIIGPYSVIGWHPEHRDFYDDRDFKESKGVLICEGTRIYEFVTIQAGTERSTIIGERSVVFNHSHIGHDCFLSRQVTIGGQVSLAGFVFIFPGATISGKSCVNQKVVIGAYAFVGGMSYVISHIPNAMKYVGYPAREVGRNEVGLIRENRSYLGVQKEYLKYFQIIKEESGVWGTKRSKKKCVDFVKSKSSRK